MCVLFSKNKKLVVLCETLGLRVRTNKIKTPLAGTCMLFKTIEIVCEKPRVIIVPVVL